MITDLGEDFGFNKRRMNASVKEITPVTIRMETVKNINDNGILKPPYILMYDI